jgi:hypothetical protein
MAFDEKSFEKIVFDEKYFPGHENRAFCERSQQPENVHTDFHERYWMFKN